MKEIKKRIEILTFLLFVVIAEIPITVVI